MGTVWHILHWTGRVRARSGRRSETRLLQSKKELPSYVEDLNKLEEWIRSYTSQDNVALIKMELSKIRLAVSSPVEVYLMQAWLFLVSGNGHVN